jgi:predicted Zn-dependent protease
MGGGHMPSLEEMKAMADKKASPLLEKLKSDPNDTDLLSRVRLIHKSTHRFKDAISYNDKALQIDPENVPTRTELASCLYYTGDLDGAIAQLQTSLQHVMSACSTCGVPIWSAWVMAEHSGGASAPRPFVVP